MKLKTIIAATLMTAAFITATSFGGYAQDKKTTTPAGQEQQQVQPDKGCPMGDLTPDQKKQIEGLKMAFMKERMALQNQIDEKKAHLKTLSMVDEPNMAEINKTIDEIYALKADLAKKKAAHIQAVRKVLTPEQRLKFDMMHKDKDMDDNCCGMGKGKGKDGMGCHQGGGQGMGCQQGGGQGMGCHQGGGQGMGCQQGGGQSKCCQQQQGAGKSCQQQEGAGQGCQQQKAACQHQQGAGQGMGCQQHQ